MKSHITAIVVFAALVLLGALVGGVAVAQPFVGAESDGLPELTRGIVPAEELGLGGEAA